MWRKIGPNKKYNPPVENVRKNRIWKRIEKQDKRWINSEIKTKFLSEIEIFIGTSDFL